MSKYNNEQMFIGSGGHLKPSKKFNWSKLWIWLAIIVIAFTLALIWYTSLGRFPNGKH